MMRYLRLSSLLFLLMLGACASHKEVWPQYKGDLSAMRFKPKYEKELYRCVVDGKVLFKKYHLSGLILFKELETGTRIVFQNEMGVTFFDFEWNKQDSFRVNSIVDQLNKPALVKVLKKDFQLLLMKGLDPKTEVTLQKPRHYSCRMGISDSLLHSPTPEVHLEHKFTLEKGIAGYIEKSARLMWIYNKGERKIVTSMALEGNNTPGSMPEKVLIDHHRANFKIQLTKIDAHANE